MISERSRLLRFAPFLVAPALASCVWLLDFDDLQTETDSGGNGAGGSAGRGGSSGTSGNGGAGDCPSECFDDDPCTVDGCTEDGECTNEDLVGLALDGVDETLPADLHTGRPSPRPPTPSFFRASR